MLQCCKVSLILDLKPVEPIVDVVRAISIDLTVAAAEAGVYHVPGAT